jgi:hypothetical protein
MMGTHLIAGSAMTSAKQQSGNSQATVRPKDDMLLFLAA